MRYSLFVSAALLSVGGVGLVTPVFADTLDQGLHAMVAGDYPRAVEELRRAVGERPRDPAAHFNLASALRGLGHPDEAVYEYHLALDLASDETGRSDALYGVALARDAQGNPELAQLAWRDYIHYAQAFRSEQPTVAIARERLAEDQRLAGRPAEIPGTQKAGR